MIQKQYITSQSVLEPLTVALLLDVMRHNEVQCVAYLFRTRRLLETRRPLEPRGKTV